MSWPVVLASGGPRERGRLYGAAAATRIGRSLELYEEVFRRYAGLSWADVRAHAEAFVEPIDAYDVQLLPEIEGIAEGAAAEAEDILTLNLRTEIMFGLDVRRDAAIGCTALGVAGVRGGPIVAQNWDWKPAVRETCVVLACAPHGRPAFVTVVEAGLVAKFGLNEHRLAVATNALNSSRDRGTPGVPYHAILRRILTSETIDEAIGAVLDGPRSSSANYLVGSADGRLVDLEVTPGGRDDAHVREGARLVHTNHFTWPTPRPFEDVGALDGDGSARRCDVAEAGLSAETPTAASIEDVLRDHANHPTSVCAHEDHAVDPIEDYVTIASFVAALGAGATWITDGPPCERPFEPVGVAGLLERARSTAASGVPTR